LHQEEIYNALQRQWATPELTLRNRAIIAILFYAGLRRSEVVKLKWADVNWQDKTLAIKGAKKRTADHVDYVPLLPQAEKHLKAWYALAGSHEHVFVSISKGGKLLADKPMSGEALRRHVCGTEFMPHDARRTLGTRSIEAGTPTNYTQKILRHASATMTLKYAEYIETQQLRDKVKLGY
jgi:integrase